MNKGDEESEQIILGDRDIPQAASLDNHNLDERLAQIEIAKVSQNYSRSYASKKFNEECKKEEARECGRELPNQQKRDKLIEGDSDDEMRDLMNNINDPMAQNQGGDIDEGQLQNGAQGVALAAYTNEEITDFFVWNDREGIMKKTED